MEVDPEFAEHINLSEHIIKGQAIDPEFLISSFVKFCYEKGYVLS